MGKFTWKNVKRCFFSLQNIGRTEACDLKKQKIFDEIMSAIVKEEQSIARENKNFRQWSINIYVNRDIWNSLKVVLPRPKPPVGGELVMINTICPHNIYMIVDKNHPPYAVFSTPPTINKEKKK